MIVIPRSTSTALASVSVGDATATSSTTAAFLKHDVCLAEKTGAACATGDISIGMDTAKFFNQIWTTTLGATNPTFDKVEWQSEWKVEGDCGNGTGTFANCKQFFDT